ncbi:MAG: amino acid adenylation domain-containing protein, partial [Proteobacteria bacterium]|nr:amino acid adenylation domain-containing protein [Pseudomonadota bacterium]
LFSFTLLTWGDQHGFFFVGHHAICDGTTCDLLFTEIARQYDARRGGGEPAPASFGSYRSFIEAEQAYLTSEECARDRDFWTAQLTPLPESPLPAADRSSTGDPTAHSVTLGLPYAPIRALVACTRRATPYLVVKAALSLVLHRITERPRIAMGFVGHGRRTPALRRSGGMMVGTYATASDLEPHLGFADVVQGVAERVRTAISSHGDYPFDRLVREINASGSLFDVSIVGHAEKRKTAYRRRFYPPGVQSEALVVHVNIDQAHPTDTLDIKVIWRADLLSVEEIARIHETLVLFLEHAAMNPNAPVGAYPLLSSQERERVLQWGLSATTAVAETPPVSLPLLHAAFEHHADATPHAIALICGDTHLTYVELERRANRVAHALLRTGLAPEERVAICLPRGVEAIVAELGVLKAGGAFVPLNPEHPGQRREAQMRLAGASALIDIPFVERLRATLPSTRPHVVTHPLQTAYVIFTSGSTGEPKGASISHGAVCNTIAGERQLRDLHAEHCVLQVAALTFDAAVWEVFGALSAGARIVVSETEGAEAVSLLGRRLQENDVTHLTLTPTLLAALDITDTVALECVDAAGEAAPTGLLQRHARHTRIINAYGPTETAICAAAFDCSDITEERAPIGRPLPGVRLYVLDAQLEPLPLGVPGRLYIGGAGVGRGYVSRPGLTAERFLPDPFSAQAGARMYDSGDRCRWVMTSAVPEASWVLEFLGRVDDQVKLRGFRIEPGEVEAALSRHEAVRNAAVDVREGRLVAWLELSPQAVGSEGFEAAMRHWLNERLPDYMVPTAWVMLERLPLNASGKVNRRALPAPLRGAERITEPRTPVEEMIAAIIADVLGIDKVGIDESF